MMMVGLLKAPLIICFLSLSFTLFPFESSGRIRFYSHFKPFLSVSWETCSFSSCSRFWRCLLGKVGDSLLGREERTYGLGQDSVLMLILAEDLGISPLSKLSISLRDS